MPRSPHGALSRRALVLCALALLFVPAALVAEAPAPDAPVADTPVTPTPLDLDPLFGAQDQASCSATCSSGVTVSCTTSGSCDSEDGVGVDCGGSCQISCSTIDSVEACRSSCRTAFFSCLSFCPEPTSLLDPCVEQCLINEQNCYRGCGFYTTSCTN